MSGTATPLRVLIADDEAIARRRLVRLLTALPDAVMAGECACWMALRSSSAHGE